MIMKIIIVLLLILLSMGFYLLIERKLMSMIHFRFGPNKVLFLGLMQFLLDMIKLIFKEYFFFSLFNYVFYFNLVFLLFIALLFWLIFSFNYMILANFNYLVILVLIMLVKLLLLSFFLFSYKSIYVQVSFIRVIVQFVSYDIVIILVVIFLMFLIMGFDLKIFVYIQKYMMLANVNYYLFIFWVFSLLMEILRLPFDFYEGESELISGFNLELGSLNFMFFFMVEYVDMIYFLNITVLIFMVGYLYYLKLLFILFFILWIRTITIRYRYDKMMILMWKKIFFFCLFVIIIMLSMLSI